MTCCEGWTSCNGFSLLILIILGVVINCIPLGISLVEGDSASQNPISCYEWWFPGIIGAGAMVIPATTMALASRKRACCNNRTGMFLSSILSVITIIGAVYCMLVSLQALSEGPLICSTQAKSTVSCEFSLKNLSNFRPESFSLQWFFEDSCISPTDVKNSTINDMLSNWKVPDSDSEEDRHRIFHFSVFLSLLLVGILELLFGISQILIGFLGCLCGVSRRRSQIV
ncbi:transmembrane 4 L6 family member 20 isoform X2 [Cricetulus griseus]|uniref:Transmembrane 4 L six family member 20 n=3 Tax=Cricetulus griseus TaxID=10029 RepID=A0A3L7IC16_CRIGR|nr:transmembrane 4 L6 family member 20 isoform X2 [Cricetulus griseus]